MQSRARTIVSVDDRKLRFIDPPSLNKRDRRPVQGGEKEKNEDRDTYLKSAKESKGRRRWKVKVKKRRRGLRVSWLMYLSRLQKF
jgi:hypothetical protein